LIEHRWMVDCEWGWWRRSAPIYTASKGKYHVRRKKKTLLATEGRTETGADMAVLSVAH